MRYFPARLSSPGLQSSTSDIARREIVAIAGQRLRFRPRFIHNWSLTLIHVNRVKGGSRAMIETAKSCFVSRCPPVSIRLIGRSGKKRRLLGGILLPRQKHWKCRHGKSIGPTVPMTGECIGLMTHCRRLFGFGSGIASIGKKSIRTSPTVRKAQPRIAGLGIGDRELKTHGYHRTSLSEVVEERLVFIWFVFELHRRSQKRHTTHSVGIKPTE